MGYSPFLKILNLFKKGNQDHSSPLLDKHEISRLFEQMKEEPFPKVYFPSDQSLYKEITNKVKKGNVNNLTRTSFYLDFFKKHPELHWAFLAHMVSRNAGYHMTDLRSPLFSHVLGAGEHRSLFSFLERCNAAIFNDAYPQLLLYEKWKLTREPPFHLLKKFNVSVFMHKMWDEFIKTGNQHVMTIALIMNEQHMIQKRILSDPDLNIGIDRWKFFLQDRLEFTSILFPYGKHLPYSLAGLSVSHFEKVDRRILLGKKLYSVLFHPSVLPTATTFSSRHPHTGSRVDYWPHLYSKEEKKNLLFSPILASAWENEPPIHLSSQDWFSDQTVDVMTPLLSMVTPQHFSMTRKWKTRTTILVNLTRD